MNSGVEFDPADDPGWAEWAARNDPGEGAMPEDEWSEFPSADAADAGDAGVDALGRVVEVDVMVSMFTARRYERVEEFRREWVAEAAARDAEMRAAAGWGQEPRPSGAAQVTTLSPAIAGSITVSRATDVVYRSMRLELSAALSITEFAADRLLAEAEALVNEYPAVLTSLTSARMTPRHASLLVEALATVETELRGPLVPRVVALAEAHPVGTFRRRLRTLIDTARVVTLPRRHAEALTTRRVVVEVGEDGMACTHLYTPAVEAHAIFDRVTRIATVIAAAPGEARSLDQIRADVIGDILLDGVPDALPPEARGIRPTVVVTVPALALLGAAGIGDEFATVEGLGPIPIERARVLAGAADGWMRVLTHPETGVVLSVGRDQYRPPPGLRRLVRWRAGTCMAPGCSIPASRCEIDHQIPWEDGGVTAASNLGPLCVGHHHVKHHGNWQVEHLPDGVFHWTSPTGRHYTVQPQRRLPTFTPADQGTAPF